VSVIFPSSARPRAADTTMRTSCPSLVRNTRSFSVENPSANPRRSREALGCGMRSRAASCVPLSPRATDRSWICLASLAFDSSSSGDSSPRSRKTFPEPMVNPTSLCARFVIAFHVPQMAMHASGRRMEAPRFGPIERRPDIPLHRLRKSLHVLERTSYPNDRLSRHASHREYTSLGIRQPDRLMNGRASRKVPAPPPSHPRRHPAAAVGLREELRRVGHAREDEAGGVPGEERVGMADRDRSQQHRLGERR